MRARWFRPPRGMQKSFTKGARVALAGPLRQLEDGGGASAGGAAVEIIQPLVCKDAGQGAGDDVGDDARGNGAHNGGAAGQTGGGFGIRARYPSVPGVGGRVLEKIVAAAVDRYADRLPEVLDPALRARLGLPAVAVALRAIHARPGAWPDEPDRPLDALTGGRSPAHRRLAFEDLLIVQLGLAAGRRQARAGAARPCDAIDGATARRLLGAALPYVFTAAQAQAIDEIARDLAAPHPMQRLLIGDVGSGKTVVAFAAAAIAAASGGQTLLMAPTEVLVEQHLRTLGGLAAALAQVPSAPVVRVARFTASMPRAERALVLARCQAGEVQLLIGTQALLEAPPVFAGLRLAIVDEQHRFGVAQRARLRRAAAGDSAAAGVSAVAGDSAATGEDDRGGGGGVAGHLLPHLLVMSATPIPRTLALTLYGDLDATFLRQGPPGRQPTATEIFMGDEGRLQAYQRLEAAVGAGRQAYVVCPVRQSATREGAVTAVARAAELRRLFGRGGARARGIRVGLLHGGLDAGEKESRLRAFADGAIDVLVATTVVELGIDVPNATVMLVEEADRYGLAQLHQLRGRVGRGAFGGECLLCTPAPLAPDGDARRRLEQLAATSDGFRIAEADMALRGHGDLFGVRQAGTPRLRFAELADYVDLLELARGES